jgi:MraZ protein
VAQGATRSGGAGPVFRGVTHLALDAKGRMAIPAKHRDGLARYAAPAVDDGADPGNSSALVLTVDPTGCLLLYPRAEWEPIQARLMAMSSFKDKIRALQRLIVGHAEDVEMDGTGRILVSPALRKYAGLDHHVVLVGQGNRFELWDETRWQEETARAITFSTGDLPPELDGFSL